MTVVLLFAVNFYYIAFIYYTKTVSVKYYISQDYLYAVAHNVGFLKRFAGL